MLKGVMFRYVHSMITCAQFEEFMIDYFEGQLPAAQRRVFELHLRICRECRDYLASYRETIALATAAFQQDDESLPDDVPDHLVTAILAARAAGHPDEGDE